MTDVHQASYHKVDPDVKTTYVDPMVRLVDSMDQMVEVWRYTRPYLTLDSIKKDTKALEKIDLPMNGMKSYIFELRTSILFRDLLYTVRPIASAWARSQRTIPFNQDNLFFSSEYKNVGINDYLQDCMHDVYQKMYDGVAQDDARALMPMAITTEYTINLDDRTLVAFLRILYKHNRNLFDIYGTLILDAIGKDVDYILNRNSLDIFDKLAISKTEYDHVGETQHLWDSVAGVFNLQARLMAQFLRQHYSTIKNELYNMIDGNKSLKELGELCENSDITVAVYANKNSYHKTLTNRAAWFAQWDHEDNASWSIILKPYIENMTPQEFKTFTRSQNGKSVYFHDLWANVTGQAVMPPDPFLIEMPSILDIRKDMLGSDSTVFKKWTEMRDAGLINDNPDNPLRKIYERFLKTGEPQTGEIEPDASLYDTIDNY